jgi:predicted nucleic acid-binding protein
MASRPKLVALDTNVLYHLAEQYAPAHNLVRRLVRSGLTPVVTQTVVQELGHGAQFGPTAQKRQSATVALSTMLQWGVQPYTLRPVGNGICDVVADVIANRDLLPPEERNDAYVLIEAGFIAAAMLVTWDVHLLKANNEKLNGVLASFDLHPVQIVHPEVILRYETG